MEACGRADQAGDCPGAAVLRPCDHCCHGRGVQDRHDGEVVAQVSARGFGYDGSGTAERYQLEVLRQAADLGAGSFGIGAVGAGPAGHREFRQRGDLGHAEVRPAGERMRGRQDRDLSLCVQGFGVESGRRVEWQVQQPSARGRPTWVPDRLPRLNVERALAMVELPLHLNWSAPGRVFDLRSRADRARVYEIVLQEGRPADILAYVDGALLVDLWDDLVLPRAVRSAWAPLVRPSAEAE